MLLRNRKSHELILLNGISSQTYFKILRWLLSSYKLRQRTVFSTYYVKEIEHLKSFLQNHFKRLLYPILTPYLKITIKQKRFKLISLRKESRMKSLQIMSENMSVTGSIGQVSHLNTKVLHFWFGSVLMFLERQH